MVCRRGRDGEWGRDKKSARTSALGQRAAPLPGGLAVAVRPAEQLIALVALVLHRTCEAGHTPDATTVFHFPRRSAAPRCTWPSL